MEGGGEGRGLGCGVVCLSGSLSLCLFLVGSGLYYLLLGLLVKSVVLSLCEGGVSEACVFAFLMSEEPQCCERREETTSPL